MNLTSKRMLIMPLAFGALALTVAAQTRWVADDFENLNVGDRAVLNLYHVPPSQMQNEFTNFTWKAQAGTDASTIEAAEGLGAYDRERPLDTLNAKAKVLKLETEGDTLTRYVKYDPVNDPRENGGLPQTIESIDYTGAAEPLWVDTLIKFMISEDDPEIAEEEQIKVALYVNADSNLVVRHYIFTGSEFDQYPSYAIIEGVTIDPEKWYRLSIEMSDKWGGEGMAFPHFSIYLDGTKLEHADACYEVDDQPQPAQENETGYIFFSFTGSPDCSLTEVSFRGSGYLDDLVVADYITDFGEAPSVVMFTLTYDSNIINVTADGAAVATEAELASGTKVLFGVADWYRLDAVTGADTYDDQTGEVTVAAAGKTVNIASKEIDAATAAGLVGDHDVDGDKLIAWAKANELGEGDVSEDDLNDFLLNVAPGSNAGLMITSIIDNGDGTVTITVSPTVALDLNEINGTLLVQTVAALGDTWSEPEEYDIVIDEETGFEAVVTVDNADGKFLKAVIK